MESVVGATVLSAPYPEGAIVQLARHAHTFGGEVVTFLPSRTLSVAASRVLDRTRGLEGRLTRGATDVPGARQISPMLEPLRLAGRVPGLRRVLPSNMTVLKRSFDHAVARRLDADVRAIVGMPGACLRSFARPVSGIRAFHAVDGHPAALNALLTAHYGGAARREMVDAAQVERIDRELGLADVVLVPSRLVQAQMTSAGVAEDRIRVAPYGVDFQRFAPVPSERVNAVPHILYVGQISYRKGIPFLLDAVRDQRVSLEMIGPVVAPELLDDLPDNVTHRTAVGHSELPSVFSRSDALVLPSVEDAFALVVAEALGSGLPVVTTTAVGSSVLVAGRQDGVVVDPGDADALRSALLEVDPLRPDARATRAARHRAAGSGVTSWDEYARVVAAAIRITP